MKSKKNVFSCSKLFLNYQLQKQILLNEEIEVERKRFFE